MLEGLISILAVTGFGLALFWLRIPVVAQGALQATSQGISAMFDGALDDDAKEVAVRRAGLRLIGTAFSILWRTGAALTLAALPLILADMLGLHPARDVLAMMLTVEYAVIATFGVMGVMYLYRRQAARGPAPDVLKLDSPYSPADRFFHALAFASPMVLKCAARLEALVMPRPAAPKAPPIFITSLARGGTTALLNAFCAQPGVATHLYRDMPFLTAPRLWHLLTGRNRQVTRHQRAHGDGLEIDLDTPEALEEVIWKMFWPERYTGATIPLWQAEDQRPQANRFLTDHMARIVTARQGRRYVSKNNANITRIPYLADAFPDCRIVVPLRRPEAHAASLLRQHRNFLARHDADDFTRRYMADLGHHEFGATLKPFAFPGVDPGAYDPETPDYWLAYWIACFRGVWAHRDMCVFVLQDDLRSAPDATMTRLCTALELKSDARTFSAFFRSGVDAAPTDIYDPALLAEAEALYRELQTQAV